MGHLQVKLTATPLWLACYSTFKATQGQILPLQCHSAQGARAPLRGRASWHWRGLVAASKELVRAASMGVEEDKLWEMQVPLQKKVFSSNDAKEGPVAFAEKRAPNWTGT